MKNWPKPIVLFITAAGIIGIIVMISGIIPIWASSGHWSITKWILSFSMERSVSTHTYMVKKVPELKDPSMIMRGAGHYEIGCRQCHGVAEAPSLLGKALTPKAPFLPPEIHKWSDKELFLIVKHGVKFTGMPAWPDLKRDDEVWSMVAFLRTLPDMNRDEYQKLVYGNQAPVPSLIKNCANCHGVDGNGRGDMAFPKLAGQNFEYLVHSLLAYKKGERHSGTMELVSNQLQMEMIHELSRYYSSQKRTAGFITPDTEALKRGSLIAKFGIPEQRVGACIGCHGPTEEGITKKPFFPDLRGQPASYLTNQLRLILEDKRGGSHHLDLMKKAVHELTEDQRRAVSLYYESLL